MEKGQLDELYHLLREVSNEGSRTYPTDITDAIYGLAGHLFAGTDYLRLIQYCKFYGEKFLLQPTYEAIQERGWQPSRIVEFGAGLGWLCRGLAVKFKTADVITVDKRPWVGTDILTDLETPAGRDQVKLLLKDGDIIVMSDFLHCVESPLDILKAFPECPMAILEYLPVNRAYAESYRTQLRRYGGNPIQSVELISDMLGGLGRKADVRDLEPYILMLIDKEDSKL